MKQNFSFKTDDVIENMQWLEHKISVIPKVIIKIDNGIRIEVGELPSLVTANVQNFQDLSHLTDKTTTRPLACTRTADNEVPSLLPGARVFDI